MPARSRGDGTPHDWSDAVRFQRARAALDAARALPLHPTQAPTMETLWEIIQQQLAALEGDPACVLSVPVGPDGASSGNFLPWGSSSGLLLEAAPPPPQLPAVAALPAPTRPPPSSPAAATTAASASVRRPMLQQHPIGTPWSARTKRKCVETGWVPEGTPSLLRPILQSIAAADVDMTASTSPASLPFRVAHGDAPPPPPPLYMGSAAAAAEATTEASTVGENKENPSGVLAGLASEVAAERRAESSFDQWLASEAGRIGTVGQSKGTAAYVTYAAALCAPTPATKRKRDAAEAEAAAAGRGRSTGSWGVSASFGGAMQRVYSALDAELDITDHLTAVHTAAVNV